MKRKVPDPAMVPASVPPLKLSVPALLVRTKPAAMLKMPFSRKTPVPPPLSMVSDPVSNSSVRARVLVSVLTVLTPAYLIVKGVAIPEWSGMFTSLFGPGTKCCSGGGGAGLGSSQFGSENQMPLPVFQVAGVVTSVAPYL